MVARELKLQLKIKQKNKLNSWAFITKTTYNFGFRSYLYNVIPHVCKGMLVCKIELSGGVR